MKGRRLNEPRFTSLWWRVRLHAYWTALLERSKARLVLSAESTLLCSPGEIPTLRLTPTQDAIKHMV
jgi:hypothetical protein